MLLCSPACMVFAGAAVLQLAPSSKTMWPHLIQQFFLTTAKHP